MEMYYYLMNSWLVLLSLALGDQPSCTMIPRDSQVWVPQCEATSLLPLPLENYHVSLYGPREVCVSIFSFLNPTNSQKTVINLENPLIIKDYNIQYKK